MAFKVFISHNTANVGLLDQLRFWLEQNGIETSSAQMYAQNGVAIGESSINEIRRSDCVLAIVSKDGYRSELADFELAIAAEAGRLVLPLIENGAVVPLQLKDKPFIQFNSYDPGAAVTATVEFLHAKRLANDKQEKLIAGAAVLAIGLLAVAAGRGDR